MELNEREIQDQFYKCNCQRFTTILPNCYPRRWFECDLLAITRASYFYEYEIKLTVSDFRADAKKGQLPQHMIKYYKRYGFPEGKTKYDKLSDGSEYGPSKFWYIVPEGLIDVAQLPDFAGLIYITERNTHLFFCEIKKAPRLHLNRMPEESRDQIRCNLYFRYWNERLRKKPE